MRFRSSLLLVVIGVCSASTVGCGGRHYHHQQYPLPEPGAAPAPVAQDAPQDGSQDPNAVATTDEPEAPAPEVPITPPEEVSEATEPPEPVYEEQTPQPKPQTVWVSGYWHPEPTGWTWYVGQWHAPPAGHVYVEPYYERVGPRVVYVRGYWHPGPVAPRTYGGTRIVFVRPARPVDYHATYHRPIRGGAGIPPGQRLDTSYRVVTITHRPAPARPVGPVARVSNEPSRARPSNFNQPPPTPQQRVAGTPSQPPPSQPSQPPPQQQQRFSSSQGRNSAQPSTPQQPPPQRFNAPPPPPPQRAAPPPPPPPRVAPPAPPPPPPRAAPPPPPPPRAAPPPPPPPPTPTQQRNKKR